MSRSERFFAAWQRLVALAFVLAAAATPILAVAQGQGGSGGTGSAGGPAGGGTGAGGGDSGGSGLAWIVVILAIAAVVYLFTRRRQRGSVTR
jgi:hypothetical protein